MLNVFDSIEWYQSKVFDSIERNTFPAAEKFVLRTPDDISSVLALNLRR